MFHWTTMLNIVSNQAKSNEHILLGLFLAIFNIFSSSEPKIITLTFWSCMKNILRLGLNHGCILHFRNIALVLVGPCLKSKIGCGNGSRKGLASNYKNPRAQRWQLPGATAWHTSLSSHFVSPARIIITGPFATKRSNDSLLMNHGCPHYNEGVWG